MSRVFYLEVLYPDLGWPLGQMLDFWILVTAEFLIPHQKSLACRQHPATSPSKLRGVRGDRNLNTTERRISEVLSSPYTIIVTKFVSSSLKYILFNILESRVSSIVVHV